MYRGRMGFAMLAMAVAVCGFLVYLVITETRKLDRAAQRFRELEDEGMDDLAPLDQLPEFRPAARAILLPDGSEADARRLLRRELRQLRAFEGNAPREARGRS